MLLFTTDVEKHFVVIRLFKKISNNYVNTHGLQTYRYWYRRQCEYRIELDYFLKLILTIRWNDAYLVCDRSYSVLTALRRLDDITHQMHLSIKGSDDIALNQKIMEDEENSQDEDQDFNDHYSSNCGALCPSQLEDNCYEQLLWGCCRNLRSCSHCKRHLPDVCFTDNNHATCLVHLTYLLTRTDFHNLLTKWKVIAWTLSIRTSFSDFFRDVQF